MRLLFGPDESQRPDRILAILLRRDDLGLRGNRLGAIELRPSGLRLIRRSVRQRRQDRGQDE